MTLLPAYAAGLAAAADRIETRRRRRTRVAALTAASTLVLGAGAAAATTLWQPQLGDDRRGHPSASVSAPPAGQLARFGVLRRAATAADRGAAAENALRLFSPDTVSGIRTDYVRLLATKPDGTAYVLVPVADAAGKPDALCVFDQDPVDGGGEACWTTQEVLAGDALMLQAAGETTSTPVPTSGADGHFARAKGALSATGARLGGLVPDGVAAVRIGAVTVPVRDNFFTAADPAPAAGGMPAVTWLDANGHEVGTMRG